MKKILILPVLLLYFSFANTINLFAQEFDQNTYYRLTTKWQGEDMSLDVVNDGENNKLQLSKAGNYLAQYWKITPLENGYHRLTSKWLGEDMSVDILNDGINNKLEMAKTGKYTGQFWKITPLEDGYYRLTTLWQGDDNALDVVNDGIIINSNWLKQENTGDNIGS